MQETKIVDLDERRKRAAFQNLMGLPDPDNLFAIPMEDIDQFLDSANDSKDDPIVLHANAIVAVKRLFTRFGIDDLPLTVGEFRGALHYCKSLQALAWSIPTTPAGDAHWDRTMANTVERFMPELHASLVAYQNKDIATLQEIHAKRLTFAVMSSYYHPEHGWLSRGKETPDTLG